MPLAPKPTCSMNQPASNPKLSGPVAWMARNGAVANLLMLLLVGAGLIGVGTLVRERFPDIPLNSIEVVVPYPGAAPNEIEESIVTKLEEALQQVGGVRDMTAIADRDAAIVVVELEEGENMDRRLSDVEAALGRIRNLPANAERPQITEMVTSQTAMRLIVHGDVPEQSLKDLIYWVEEEITALPEVSNVDVSGIRPNEVSIEISDFRLRSLGLTINDVAAAIRRASLDLSAGTIKTDERDVLVRTTGLRRNQMDFEDVELVSGLDGTGILLGDVARVRDDVEDSDIMVWFDGQPAGFIDVNRVGDEDIRAIGNAVNTLIEEKLTPALPQGVDIVVWNDDAELYARDVGNLTGNFILGLVVILLMLALFLNIRLAFWVAAGIAMAFVGTFGSMAILDISLNSISLFAFVMALGVVVDDAVVVAESVYHERQKGLPGVLAATVGARRIQKPLIFAVLTTIVAFMPLALVSGPTASSLQVIPVVLGSILLLSLVESLLVLPNHLSHIPGPGWTPSNRAERLVNAVQTRVDKLMQRAIDGPIQAALKLATGRPVVVLAGAGAVFILVMSLIPAGIVPVRDVPPVEGEFATATLELPEGTPASRTNDVTREVEAAARRAALSLEREDETLPSLITGVSRLVGTKPRSEFGGGFIAQAGSASLGHTGTIQVRLVEPEQRPGISGERFGRMWRDEAGDIPGAGSLEINTNLYDPGSAVSLNVWHDDPGQEDVAVDALIGRLDAVEGMIGARTDRGAQMAEIELEPLPAARAMGISLEAMAHQVRAAFFGVEALRFQRGPEDVGVFVRLPAEERSSIGDLERIHLSTPSGRQVPLGNVARVSLTQAPSSIRRVDAQRVINVEADADQVALTMTGADALVRTEILPQMQADYPGFQYRLAGRQKAAQDMLDSIGSGFLFALLAIYGLLVIPLGSLTKPFLIMVIVPFGLVGAVAGHIVLGMDMTYESFLGIIGLSGIVVNDSLVMMDAIDTRIDEGWTLREAVVGGAKERFRPIFLTTITTFLGFAPTIFDTSVSAQVRNMAVSIGIGVFVATAILMLLVPAATVVMGRKRLATS